MAQTEEVEEESSDAGSYSGELDTDAEDEEEEVREEEELEAQELEGILGGTTSEDDSFDYGHEFPISNWCGCIAHKLQLCLRDVFEEKNSSMKLLRQVYGVYFLPILIFSFHSASLYC
jgi:hypothetical protein